MGRKEKREYTDDEPIGLPPAYISGADHKLLVGTLKTIIDTETGKPMKLGKWINRLVMKQVQAIRAGKFHV